MKKIALLISVICFSTTFAVARRTVRKRSILSSIQTSNETATPVKILEKPRPQRKAGQDCSQGKVVLRVTFPDSGEIGKISVISGLTNNNAESAIEAAKKIKFAPATRDGKPWSIGKPVKYGFTIY